ncbi:uncharacterized protein LOC110179837 [Drosophila serrata]|uniref:uncharacterized protein LOC110179837 n=1 Tax=Drosophila serrata TaxID=7274 RepID=UPI000A1D1FCE|nr:uncharacterized protein LOC110179837 [Drosophila serrata]
MSRELLLVITILVCGILATRAEDGTTTEGEAEASSSTSSPAFDENDEDSSLILGNLSLCGNVADNVFLPFVGDCNKYYLCRSGQAIALQCEWPYQFDAPSQSCVNPGKADCLPTCEAFNFTTFSYQRTCTKYVLCYYGRPVLRECHDGLQYNSQTDRCDFPKNVDCVESECSIYYNAYHLRYVPSKVSCEKYFLCGNGVPREQTCTSGLYFSTKCDCCDIPSNSDCQIPADQRKAQFFSRLRPGVVEGICPPTGIHIFAHESRQDAYYYCVEGHGLILDCSPGLWYDPKIQECREPHNLGR